VLEKILKWSGYTTAISALITAFMGFAVVVFLGPSLAMGIAIYSGHTEPILPDLPPPLTTLIPIAFGIGLLIISKKRPMLAWISLGGALAALGMEFSYLMELFEIAKDTRPVQ
jgi:hypothetical protein